MRHLPPKSDRLLGRPFFRGGNNGDKTTWERRDMPSNCAACAWVSPSARRRRRKSDLMSACADSSARRKAFMRVRPPAAGRRDPRRRQVPDLAADPDRAPTYNNIVPTDRPALIPVLTTHMLGEVTAIAQALPNDRIALQWDVCQEVIAWEGY